LKNIIFAHNNCADGAAAATAIYLYLTGLHGKNDVSVHFVNYGDGKHMLVDVTDANVYIVDFSFPRDDIVKMAGLARHITVLDHHKTALADLGIDVSWKPSNVDITFDMQRSGCMLAWAWTQEQRKAAGTAELAEVPALYAYVQDRDLWQFKLPYSKEVSAYIANGVQGVERFEQLLYEFATDMHRVINIGTALYNYQLDIARKALKNAVLVKAQDGTPFVLVNATTVISETCHMALEQRPEAAFSCSYFDNYVDGKRIVSLRGRDSDDFDVSVIAKRFGGGGHKKAAGFSLPLSAAVEI